MIGGDEVVLMLNAPGWTLRRVGINLHLMSHRGEDRMWKMAFVT